MTLKPPVGGIKFLFLVLIHSETNQETVFTNGSLNHWFIQEGKPAVLLWDAQMFFSGFVWNHFHWRNRKNTILCLKCNSMLTSVFLTVVWSQYYICDKYQDHIRGWFKKKRTSCLAVLFLCTRQTSLTIVPYCCFLSISCRMGTFLRHCQVKRNSTFKNAP